VGGGGGNPIRSLSQSRMDQFLSAWASIVALIYPSLDTLQQREERVIVIASHCLQYDQSCCMLSLYQCRVKVLKDVATKYMRVVIPTNPHQQIHTPFLLVFLNRIHRPRHKNKTNKESKQTNKQTHRAPSPLLSSPPLSPAVCGTQIRGT